MKAEKRTSHTAGRRCDTCHTFRAKTTAPSQPPAISVQRASPITRKNPRRLALQADATRVTGWSKVFGRAHFSSRVGRLYKPMRHVSHFGEKIGAAVQLPANVSSSRSPTQGKEAITRLYTAMRHVSQAGQRGLNALTFQGESGSATSRCDTCHRVRFKVMDRPCGALVRIPCSKRRHHAEISITVRKLTRSADEVPD